MPASGFEPQGPTAHNSIPHPRVIGKMRGPGAMPGPLSFCVVEHPKQGWQLSNGFVTSLISRRYQNCGARVEPRLSVPSCEWPWRGLPRCRLLPEVASPGRMTCVSLSCVKKVNSKADHCGERRIRNWDPPVTIGARRPGCFHRRRRVLHGRSMIDRSSERSSTRTTTVHTKGPPRLLRRSAARLSPRLR